MWCRHETAAKDAAVLPSLKQAAVYSFSVVYYGCTGWLLSESVSNLCLCFRTRASTVSQQVQSVLFRQRINSDQVTAQSSRCKLSVGKKTANSCVFIY